MKLYNEPTRAQWAEITARPTFDNSQLTEQVSSLLAQIREGGDSVLFDLEARFDHATLTTLQVTPEEFDEARRLIAPELAEAIDRAAENIAAFHRAQQQVHAKIETTPGVLCWQKSVPIDKVGLYVPGGTAPLFSTVLMLAVPAGIAGCRQVVLCSPPDAEGRLHPAILYAAWRSGVSAVFKLGGVQAIGAMAYGTETVPKVYKIFGPGNQYVQMAKQLVSLRDVAIDMPAGPSEVAVIADDSSHPAFVASDFLSQAEHGADSQSVLFTTSADFARRFEAELQRQVALLPRQQYMMSSLSHSKIVVMTDEAELMELVNEYAPEHLIIQTRHYAELAEHVRNAGSVFMGPYSPESAGDYASGTNHTLPTNGYAKAYNGVNLDSYMRKITFQELSADGLLRLGPVIEVMAAHEMLDAHKNAVTLRLKELSD